MKEYSNDSDKNHDRLKSLEERISHLEGEVQRLIGENGGLGSEGVGAGFEKPLLENNGTSASVEQSGVAELSDWHGESRSSGRETVSGWHHETWLNRLGIGLVLFGIAFFFKYAIDQGWLMPIVRVVIGVVGSVGLVALGVFLVKKKLHLAQAFAGGGVCGLYISFFAAFQLYHLWPTGLTFFAMGAVTVIGFIFSTLYFGVPVAVIAALGGYVTPFVLYTGSENIAGLIVYAALLSLGGCAVSMRLKSQRLLWLTFAGSWFVMLAAYTSAGFISGHPRPGAAMVIQLSIIWFWGMFTVLSWIPVRIKRALHAWFDDTAVQAMVLMSPMIAVLFSERLWEFSDHQWCIIWIGMAAIYGAAVFILQRLQAKENLVWTYMLTGLILLSYGLWHVLNHSTFFLFVAVEATALHGLVARVDARWLSRVAHVLSAVIIYVLFVRLLTYKVGIPAVWNAQAWTDLVVMALCSLIAWKYAKSNRKVYALAAYAALLLWFYRELATLENGQAFVSVAWSMCGAASLAVAFRMVNPEMRRLGMATLLLVVIKLFLVDLAQIEAIWRVLTSLGLGGLFLLLSYFLPDRWDRNRKMSS